MSSPTATVLVRMARRSASMGVLALHAIILFEHGEDLEAHPVKVVAPLALVDLSGLVHANEVGQVRGQ
eukprot:1079792-Pleurochrysis_carterae.AAC.1